MLALQRSCQMNRVFVSSPSIAGQSSLKVLFESIQIYCRGLKYIAKNLDERIEGIVHHLANGSHDIIALQEIWVFAHYERVQQRVSTHLPHSKFFYRYVTFLNGLEKPFNNKLLPHLSGALGAGLAIFSRYPFVSTGILPYSLNGTPLDVAGGDWFVGKAAAHVTILHPILGQVQLFNTHVRPIFFRSNYVAYFIHLCSFLRKEGKTVLSITGLTVSSTHGSLPSSLGRLQKWANMSLPCVYTSLFPF